MGCRVQDTFRGIRIIRGFNRAIFDGFLHCEEEMQKREEQQPKKNLFKGRS